MHLFYNRQMQMDNFGNVTAVLIKTSEFLILSVTFFKGLPETVFSKDNKEVYLE